MTKVLNRIEQLEQKAIWDRAHDVCTVFSERLFQICNNDERCTLATHLEKIKGVGSICDLLTPTGHPDIDQVLAKARDNPEVNCAYLELCRLVELWNYTQLHNLSRCQ